MISKTKVMAQVVSDGVRITNKKCLFSQSLTGDVLMKLRGHLGHN